MLILSRKCNERIVIGKTGEAERDCLITVISIQGGKVRLGVDADPRTRVRRGEVAYRIRSDEQGGDSK
jgi:carbon storage regulator CsrA